MQPNAAPTQRRTGRGQRTVATFRDLRPRPAEVGAAWTRLVWRLSWSRAWKRYDDAIMKGRVEELHARFYVAEHTAQLYRRAAQVAGVSLAQLVRVALARFVLDGPHRPFVRPIEGPRVELGVAVAGAVAIYAVGAVAHVEGHVRPAHWYRAAVERDAGRLAILVGLEIRDASAYLTLGKPPAE